MKSSRREEQQPETAGKTESFWSAHARLLAFLCTVAVFLALFIPLGVIGVGVVWDHMDSCGDTRRDMTEEELYALAKRETVILSADLDGYVGDRSEVEMDGMRAVIYQIEVGDRYYLTASFNVGTGKAEYITVTDFETGSELDLLDKSADVDAFFERRSDTR